MEYRGKRWASVGATLIVIAWLVQSAGWRDTIRIQAGTVLGYQALVAGLLARVRRELADLIGADAASITGIITGGLSAAPWARGLGEDIVDPDLTLKGLQIFHEAVRGTERLEATA